MCDPNADCYDTPESYNCSCKEGYEGDGYNCTGETFQIIIIMSVTALLNA